MLKTFKDAYVFWDQAYKVSGITMSTYSKTEGYFKNHILPFFGEKKLAKLMLQCASNLLSDFQKLKYFHHIVNYASDVMETAFRLGDIHKILSSLHEFQRKYLILKTIITSK